jgi:hypothetical protein
LEWPEVQPEVQNQEALLYRKQLKIKELIHLMKKLKIKGDVLGRFQIHLDPLLIHQGHDQGHVGQGQGHAGHVGEKRGQMHTVEEEKNWIWRKLIEIHLRKDLIQKDFILFPKRKNELVDVTHPVEAEVEAVIDIHVDEDHAQVAEAAVEAAVETEVETEVESVVEAAAGLEFIQKNRKNLGDIPQMSQKKKVWNKKDSTDSNEIQVLNENSPKLKRI